MLFLIFSTRILKIIDRLGFKRSILAHYYWHCTHYQLCEPKHFGLIRYVYHISNYRSACQDQEWRDIKTLYKSGKSQNKFFCILQEHVNFIYTNKMRAATTLFTPFFCFNRSVLYGLDTRTNFCCNTAPKTSPNTILQQCPLLQMLYVTTRVAVVAAESNLSLSKLVHTGRQVAATRRGNKCCRAYSPVADAG